jgi:predicted transcriptional regulator
LQEAFLLYEDQTDGEWDRGWCLFSEMFSDVNLSRYTRQEGLKILLRRFAYRHVAFDFDMARYYYKLPAKETKAAIEALVEEGVFIQSNDSFLLRTDAELLQSDCGDIPHFVYAMHRNDFLVKSNEHWLKAQYTHNWPDTLYYLLIDGEFRGTVVGKFRYTPEVEDVLLDLADDEAAARKEEILQAIHVLCGANNPIRRYQGVLCPNA